jgi:hypothetical protein
MPTLLTNIDELVSAVDHKYELYPSPAFKVVTLPAQKDNVPEMNGAGGINSEIYLDIVSVQLLASVTVNR